MIPPEREEKYLERVKFLCLMLHKSNVLKGFCTWKEIMENYQDLRRMHFGGEVGVLEGDRIIVRKGEEMNTSWIYI